MVATMKDLLDREIKIGDIVAHGTRSGNSGAISIKIVVDKRDEPIRFNEKYTREELKVINYAHITREYNDETSEWQDVEPYYKKSGTGWAQGNLLIINESVPQDLKDFLQSLL